MTSPSPATIERVPAWVDKARLCFETCLGDTTVDDWVKRGLLPAPVKRGHKLMWEWSEVSAYLRNGGPAAQDSEVSRQEQIRRATERRNHVHQA